MFAAYFLPFPKNPIISSFFRQINYAEELGSGFKKIAQYAKTYFGNEPVIEEKDIFRFEAFLNNEIFNIKNEPLKINELQNEILNIIKTNPDITKDEIADNLNKSRATITRHITVLKNIGLLKRVGSDKTGYWEIIK